MSCHVLVLPDDFDQYAWELEFKGWFPAAKLSYSGRMYSLTFYDAVSLGQSVDFAIQGEGIFLEQNLVVVKSVTRVEMERAAARIVSSGMVHLLVAD